MKPLINALLISLLAIAPAVADPLVFAFRFSGADYLDGVNPAVASGTITFDSTLLGNPNRNVWDVSTGSIYSGTGNYGTNIPGLVTALSVTVTGATNSADNGTFTLADYDAVLFDTTSRALNLGQQLLGQATASPNGKTWGEDDAIPGSTPSAAYTGGFQLFAVTNSHAPSQIDPFQLGTGGGNVDGMQLVFFAPFSDIPEPASFALVGLGLGLMGWWNKQRAAYIGRRSVKLGQ